MLICPVKNPEGDIKEVKLDCCPLESIDVCPIRFMIHKDNHQVLAEYYSVYLNAVSEHKDTSEHMQQEGLIPGSFFPLACMFVADNAPDQRTYPHQS